MRVGRGDVGPLASVSAMDCLRRSTLNRMKRYVPLAALALVAAAGAAGTPAMAQDARPELSPMSRVTAARVERAKETGNSGDRVFGGNEADPGEWPFQVALLSAGM